MKQTSTERVLADVIRTRLAGRGAGLTTGRVKDHPESVAVKDTDGRVYVVTVRSEQSWLDQEEAGRFVSALYEVGVDNWEGYGHACGIAREDPVDVLVAEWICILTETEDK